MNVVGWCIHGYILDHMVWYVEFVWCCVGHVLVWCVPGLAQSLCLVCSASCLRVVSCMVILYCMCGSHVAQYPKFMWMRIGTVFIMGWPRLCYGLRCVWFMYRFMCCDYWHSVCAGVVSYSWCRFDSGMPPNIEYGRVCCNVLNIVCSGYCYCLFMYVCRLRSWFGLCVSVL